MVDVWIMSALATRRKWLLDGFGDDRSIRVRGSAPTFSLLRTLMSEAAADLAIVDLDTSDNPDLNRWIQELLEQIPVLCLASQPHLFVFNCVMSAGAGGILPYDTTSARVIEAIKCIASGLVVFDGALARQLQPHNQNDMQAAESLTPRETEVLELLAEGLGNKEIAAQLNITPHTIKFHIRSILSKLGASSRIEAVRLGLRSGLIDL